MNKDQVKLIHVAARAAGIRDGKADGRYRFLLAQYKKSNGQICASCKDLNNYQVDDFLAICESLGWRYPGQSVTYYRDKRGKARDGRYASPAQLMAIDYMAGDLGISGEPLKRFCLRMTKQRMGEISGLTGREAYIIIEALKAALSRQDGRSYETLADVADQYKHGLNEFCGVVMDDCPI